MNRFGPVPFPIGHGLEAAEARIAEPAFEAVPQAGVELRLDEVFEQDDGAPPLLGGAGHEVIQLGRGVDESELTELVTQRRRNRFGRGRS